MQWQTLSSRSLTIERHYGDASIKINVQLAEPLTREQTIAAYMDLNRLIHEVHDAASAPGLGMAQTVANRAAETGDTQQEPAPKTSKKTAKKSGKKAAKKPAPEPSPGPAADTTADTSAADQMIDRIEAHFREVQIAAGIPNPTALELDDQCWDFLSATLGREINSSEELSTDDLATIGEALDNLKQEGTP